MRRIIGILLAFVMIFMSVSALEGVVMVKADEPTNIYFNDVTITGIIGTPIEEQDFEIYVENGKFDVAQFYIGKDISNLMRGDGRARTDGFRRYIVEGGYDSSWGYIDTYTLPYGLKAIVTEATEKKITCTISGTPLSPSKESISVMIRNEMFSEFTANPTYPTRLYP